MHSDQRRLKKLIAELSYNVYILAKSCIDVYIHQNHYIGLFRVCLLL